MSRRLVHFTLILSLSAFIAAPGGERKSQSDIEVDRVLASIKGKEKMPAGEVFQNVKLLSNVPAERLLRIMQQGYSKALGVSCDHCHVEDAFESDEKRPKLATREMIGLTTSINTQLKAMRQLDADSPTVNCNTCHKGSIFPATQE